MQAFLEIYQPSRFEFAYVLDRDFCPKLDNRRDVLGCEIHIDAFLFEFGDFIGNAHFAAFKLGNLFINLYSFLVRFECGINVALRRIGDILALLFELFVKLCVQGVNLIVYLGIFVFELFAFKQLFVFEVCPRCRLVNHVYCLIGQETVVYISFGQYGGGADYLVGYFDLVIILIMFFYSFENVYCFVNGGFLDHYGLESAL